MPWTSMHLANYLPEKSEKGNPVLKSYLVSKRDLHIGGGKIRKVGELIPEAHDFTPRVRQALIGSKDLVGVVVVTPREYKKLSQFET